MSDHDTDQDELRDLLHRVVPEAPEPEPAHLARAGRRARTRGRIAAVGAAAAVVVAAAVVGPRVLPADDPAPEVATFDPPPDPVYDAVPCPAVLPSTRTSNKTVPDLDRVVGVRLCGDAAAGRYNRSGPSYPASPEALVEGVPRFRAAVRALPVALPDRCANADGFASREALALLLDDGSTLLLGQTWCGDNEVEGRTVAANAVVQAFLGALDTQRDAASYGLRVDPLTCDTPVTHSPARPGRERVIGAVVCGRDGGAVETLTPTAVSRLRSAWADPRTVTQDLNELGENECTEGATDPRQVVLTTDRGDVVRLYASPCGYLVHSDWRIGESTQVPVTFADLGR